jgi:hypothetical protein
MPCPVEITSQLQQAQGTAQMSCASEPRGIGCYWCQSIGKVSAEPWIMFAEYPGQLRFCGIRTG